MGFGPFSSESSTSSTTNNADNKAVASEKSLLNYEQFGQSSLSSRAGTASLTNSSGNKIDVQSLDAPLINRALDVLDHVVTGQSSLSLANANQSSDALASANAAAAAAAERTDALAKTKLTDGANVHQKTILIGAAIIAALIGVFYLSRRS